MPTRYEHLGAIEQAMWSTLPTRFQQFRHHQIWKVAGRFIHFGFLKEQTHKERVSKKMLQLVESVTLGHVMMETVLHGVDIEAKKKHVSDLIND